LTSSHFHVTFKIHERIKCGTYENMAALPVRCEQRPQVKLDKHGCRPHRS